MCFVYYLCYLCTIIVIYICTILAAAQSAGNEYFELEHWLYLIEKKTHHKNTPKWLDYTQFKLARNTPLLHAQLIEQMTINGLGIDAKYIALFTRQSTTYRLADPSRDKTQRRVYDTHCCVYQPFHAAEQCHFKNDVRPILPNKIITDISTYSTVFASDPAKKPTD